MYEKMRQLSSIQPNLHTQTTSKATLYTQTHMYTQTHFPVVHNPSIKEGAVSMGVAAEGPQCSAARSPRGVDKLSQRCFLTSPLPLPKRKKVCTPYSGKLQAAADFSITFLCSFARLHLTTRKRTQHTTLSLSQLIHYRCAFLTLKT